MKTEPNAVKTKKSSSHVADKKPAVLKKVKPKVELVAVKQETNIPKRALRMFAQNCRNVL